MTVAAFARVLARVPYSQRLTKREAEAVYRVHGLGLTREDAAAEMEISRTSVEMLLSRATSVLELPHGHRNAIARALLIAAMELAGMKETA